MNHWKVEKKKRHGGVAKDIFAWHENEKVIIFVVLSAGNIPKKIFIFKKNITILLIHTDSTTDEKVQRKSMH